MASENILRFAELALGKVFPAPMEFDAADYQPALAFNSGLRNSVFRLSTLSSKTVRGAIFV